MTTASGGATRGELQDRLSAALKALRMRVEPRHDALYRAGLGPSGFLLMQYLGANGPRRISDVARVLSVTSASVTGITNNLVRDGYIERLNDDQDRRVVRLQVTALGRSKLQEARAASHRRVAELLVGYGDGDLEQLVALLEQLVATVVARDGEAEQQT